MKRYKKISKKYWIRLTLIYREKDGEEFKEVKGKKVSFKGLEELDLFLHGERHSWSISEGVTGCSIVKYAETQTEARITLEVVVDSMKGESLDRLAKGIHEGVALFGISPRYEEVKDTQ